MLFRTIKIWDLAKCCAGAEGGLKLTLTGHINAVRGLAVSQRHPYLFSCSEDKKVFCWDLEYNKVIRHYHGHLSAVFCCTIHPTLDLLFTGGRDSVTRVWDIRTKQQIHVLGGHSGAVSSIIANPVDPQVISASHDSTIKLWDLAAGKSMSTLTQHKKAVRAIAGSNKEFTFASASADNVKKWQCRDGKFLRNMTPANCVQNCAAINDDGVLVCGGDNGSLNFWDYETGYRFQSTDTIVQPGMLLPCLQLRIAAVSLLVTNNMLWLLLLLLLLWLLLCRVVGCGGGYIRHGFRFEWKVRWFVLSAFPLH